MDIKTYKKLFPYLVKANVPTITWGKHGIGKTQVHRQLAKEMGLNFVYLTFGAAEDVGDVIGLQEIQEIDGTHKAVFVKPEWFPTKPGNLIFIDEFNRANKSILQAMYPFILEGRLGTHQLPERSFVALAANPPTDGYTVTDVSDLALMSRMCHVVLDPTVEEWLDYARHKGVNRVITEFIAAHPGHLHGTSIDTSFLDVKPDNRAVEKFAQFIDICPDTDLVNHVARGMLGDATTATFMAFREKFTYYIRPENIVKGMPESDKLFLATLLEQHRVDAIHNTNEELFIYLQKNKKEVTDTWLYNILDYIKVLPNELAFNVARKMLQDQKKLAKDHDRIQQIIGEDAGTVDRFTGLKESVLGKTK